MSPSFPPTSQLQEPSPLPAASQRLPLPGWLRRGVAKSVPFLAPQSNVVSFRLFSPPSSQTPYSQKCPFASRPPVHAPSMQLCLRSLGALRCAYCRGRPMRRPSTLKKKKKKKRKKRKKEVHFCWEIERGCFCFLLCKGLGYEKNNKAEQLDNLIS